MRHYDKKGNWSERKRIRNHQMFHNELFHIYYGKVTVRRMWLEHNYSVNTVPHDDWQIVLELVTDTGMRFIEYKWDVVKHCTLADGSEMYESF